MVKVRLLQAVCAVALLAAVPAFAQQTTTQPADTGAGNSVNAPVAHDSSAPVGSAMRPNMAPAEKMGSTSGSTDSASSMSHSTHHSAMGSHTSGAMHERADDSQNGAVDQLNDQSFQAAQRGQAFSASDSGSMSSGAGHMGHMGHMNDMSGGSTGSPAGAASGSGGGAAGSGGGSGK